MELWYWHHSYLNSPGAVPQSEAIIDQAAAAGYTGLALWDTGINDLQYGWWNPAPMQQVVQYAMSKGLKVMPLVAPYGHSVDMVRQNWGYGEGERVVGTQFQVDPQGQTLQVVNSFPGLTNGGFEQGKTAWFGFNDPGTNVDYSVHHSGNASGVINSVAGNSRFSQTFTVQPWRQYHMRMFTKTQNFTGYAQVQIYGNNNYANSRVNQSLSTPITQDWTQWDTTFNSGPFTTMSILMGVFGGSGGTLWFDDISMEETALVYVQRGPSVPLTVYDPNNPSHTFVENTDFGAVSDPQFLTDPTFDNYWHQPMVIPVRAGSSLKPGQTVAMNWYAMQPIQGDMGASLTDPGAWQWMQQNAAAVVNTFPNAAGLFLGYDEMRHMNGTASAVAKNMTPGQLLAWHFQQVYQLFRQTNPATPIYVWSDMFDPFHNAINNYYLVEGDLSGSWTGLPADVILMNWNLGALTSSTNWFSGKNALQPVAHRQIIAGYYDSGNGASSAASELTLVSGIPGIIGMMYTTFNNDYSQLASFAATAKAGWSGYQATLPAAQGQNTQPAAPAKGPAATFVKTDFATKGNWLSNYGADGYNVVGDQSSNPSYAGPSVTGQYTFTYVPSTQDIRAMQKPSNPADRLFASWFSTSATSSFLIDTNITDTATHQVALYCIDYESSLRKQTIDVLDVNGNVLNTQQIANFESGLYLVWNVTGHVKFRVTSTGQYNAVVMGLFFGGSAPSVPAAPAAPSATATFVKTDATTLGNWRSAYGLEGYSISGDLTQNPSYGAPAASNDYNVVYVPSTQDPRALQKASNPADRLFSSWFSTSQTGTFYIDTNITDNLPHQVALYCIDYESSLRKQTIDVLDANGNVLNTQQLANFEGGVYLIWTVTGHVKFRVTSTGQYNAVVDGVFFGGPLQSAPAAKAAFVKTDTTTLGNWRSTYGAEGYSVSGDLSLNPSYGAPVVSNDYNVVYVPSTQDVRALQKASNPTDRLFSSWFSTSQTGTFYIDTNITDNLPHQVALYCIDYESSLRKQTIDVLDANGNVLNTQQLANFEGGVYLIWTVTGHVKFRVTSTGQYNAVVDGVFFGGPLQSAPAAKAAFVKTDTTTLGNWRSTYGAEGYSVSGDLSLNPSYGAPVVSNDYNVVYVPSTQDVRALQKASNPTDRLFSSWFSTSQTGTFYIDTNITDNLPHQVALYCIDYESSLRKQTIDVLDANGNVLNTQQLANFEGGVYLIWTVTGHVKFRVTSTGQYNAVVDGVFFGGPLQSAPAATAAFVKTDTTTLGNWRSTYGAEGYSVSGDLSLNPSYGAPVVSNDYNVVYVPSTQDVRALQKASNPTDRLFSSWFSTSQTGTFYIDTNITDNLPHQVALYCIDYESSLRKQTIDVLDANGNVLNTQQLANFEGGVYLIWTVTGHVKFRVTSTGQYNAVVDGVFFGGPQ